jgi:hypothetical protein
MRKLPEHLRRDAVVQVLLTQNEYSELETQAKRTEQAISPYARQLLLQQMKKAPSRSNKMISVDTLTTR